MYVRRFLLNLGWMVLKLLLFANLIAESMEINKNSGSDTQRILFDRLKNSTTGNTSLIDTLSDLLNVGTDGVYRRMRGEKLLDLDELSKICGHFRVSIDGLMGINRQALDRKSVV